MMHLPVEGNTAPVGTPSRTPGSWRVPGGFGPSVFGWYSNDGEQRKLGSSPQVVVAEPLEVAEPLR